MLRAKACLTSKGHGHTEDCDQGLPYGLSNVEPGDIRPHVLCHEISQAVFDQGTTDHADSTLFCNCSLKGDERANEHAETSDDAFGRNIPRGTDHIRTKIWCSDPRDVGPVNYDNQFVVRRTVAATRGFALIRD